MSLQVSVSFFMILALSRYFAYIRHHAPLILLDFCTLFMVHTLSWVAPVSRFS
ncbi:hypothetical protein EDB19DRAFT_1655096 [Suillus lakei]|nr:hypothetical protein EDB19DRAFT_1655096 [Suillus lakei]